MEGRMTFVAVMIFLLAMVPVSSVTAARSDQSSRFQLIQDMLGLSDEQVAKIDEIFVAAEQYCGTAEEATSKQQCVVAFRNSIENALTTILNDSQLTQLNLIRSDRDTLKSGAGSFVEMLKAVLDLSDEQVGQLQTAMKSAQSECEADKTAADLQICLGGKRTQIDAAIEALLTEDQLATFRALKEEEQAL